MTHMLKIGLSKDTPPDGGIVRCRRVGVRERLLRLLLGEKQRLTILIPGDSVKTLSITEEGGADDGQDE